MMHSLGAHATAILWERAIGTNAGKTTPEVITSIWHKMRRRFLKLQNTRAVHPSQGFTP